MTRGFAGRTAAVWAAAVMVAGGIAVLVLMGAADDWRAALAAGCASLAVLLLTGLLVQSRRLSGERAERDRAERLAAARSAEVVHLAGVRAPAIAERVRAGQRLEGVPGPIAAPGETGAEFERAVSAMIVALGSDEAMRRERGLRDSVQAAFESVARTMHAMASVQQQLLDQVEQSIDDSRVMADVMKADHAAAQMTRKAQTLLVMCGVWPARRENRPVSLYDCVRGAQSRIVEYSRIEVRGGQTLYAVAPAVEGLMHAIAELLDNATTFSPQNHPVVVNIREVGAGAVIEIEDAGRGMPQDVLEQATRLLRDDQDLARLGAVPRLGLACVGRWSRELGFEVKLNGTSAYGGTCAVTFVPFHLMTEPAGQSASPARWPEPYGVPQQRRDEPATVLMSGHGQPAAGAGPSAAWAESADLASASAGAGAPVPSATTNGGQLPFSAQPLPDTAPPQPPAPAGGPAAPAVQAQPAAQAQPPAQAAPDRTTRSTAPTPAEATGSPAPPAAPHVTSGPLESSATSAAQPDPSEPAAPAETPTGLPRRRSRRGAAHAAMQSLPAAAQQQRPAPVPQPAPATDPWTPEAAGASIASVVSGTLRGRAELHADEPPTDPPAPGPGTTAAPLPPLEPSPPPTPDEYDGGRP
ncbi:ATP-binding protein [Streptomyces sp. YIM 130001]|uniref:ATP-binding protein n=1 Tax=Streptomyces sp. YIM 130001 TaxID=2259644 RepID=UPI0032047F92